MSHPNGRLWAQISFKIAMFLQKKREIIKSRLTCSWNKNALSTKTVKSKILYPDNVERHKGKDITDSSLTYRV